jgi:hypothetical protein
MTTHTFKPGDRVTYKPPYGRVEQGIVKSLRDDSHVFVVYHCGGNWSDYCSYTAARTHIEDLILGWKDTP